MNLVRKVLAAIAFGLIAQSAEAEWVLLARNEDMRVFADRQNIDRTGSTATALQLVDYTSAQWEGAAVIMSVIYAIEVDCPGKRLRTLAATAYSEQMGRGRQVVAEKSPNEEWNGIPPGGSAEQLWNIVCGKR